MLVESEDLLTQANAAYHAGVPLARLLELVKQGQVRPFVTIDGQPFYHRREVAALRRMLETMAGRRPTRALPRMPDLF